MEKVEYAGWPNCIRLSNSEIEIIVTTDVGPRIIRCGFIGEQNLFKEYPDLLGLTGGEEWNIFGGHRLWHAPEVMPRTYAPDNEPVEHEWSGQELKIIQPMEPTTGIQKELEIVMHPDRNEVTVLHRLFNRNPWDIETAPWALTVMAEGGRAVYPQEEFRRHEDFLDPARPLVLWHYTDLSDPRWTLGARYIQLQQEPGNTKRQKLGFLNKQGWAAYTLNGDVFIKKYPYHKGATYADYGCNTETFTMEDMLEVETLAPFGTIAANGGHAEHVEQWKLAKADIGTDEDDIDRNLLPLL